jgi:hypothetical protein
MFEKAARLKLRFDSPKGLVTVEDLFDLPLTVRNGGASLDNVAKGIARQIRETETESFVLTTSKADTILQLKLEIVKHVIAIKKAEADAADKAAEKKATKQKILAIIADKKDEQLKGSSIEDLEKQLETL